MKDSKFPKNSLYGQNINKISNSQDDISEYATNSLIMNDCYRAEKNLMQDIQVMEAKIDVDNNHK